jgi:outer membrane protein
VLACQAGVDYHLTDQSFINLDLRWIDIDTDAKLGGENLGTVKIDPVVVGLHLGWKF